MKRILCLTLTLVCSLLATACQKAQTPSEKQVYDLIVYGGTEGEIISTISAAREGVQEVPYESILPKLQSRKQLLKLADLN